jgi:hypothetical protein
MTGKQAGAVMGGPVRVSPSQAIPGNQSSCLYSPDGSLPGALIVNVSWDTRSIANFTALHGGLARIVPGTTPTGAKIPPVEYTKVSVDGSTAYWVPLLPVPSGSNAPTNSSQLSGTVHGYVVTLISMGLNQSQDERALGLMLRQLNL